MATPEIKLGFVHNLFSRMMHFKKAGDIEQGHTHQFDHLTLLAKGSLRVSINGIQTTFVAPHMIFIRKDKMHELTALEDDTLAYCIHAVTTDTEDIVDASMIPKST